MYHRFINFCFDPEKNRVLAILGWDREEYSNPDSPSLIAEYYGRDEGDLINFEIPIGLWEFLDLKQGKTLFEVFKIKESNDLLMFYEGGLSLGCWEDRFFDTVKKWQEKSAPAIVEAGKKVFNLEKYGAGIQIFTCQPNTMIELSTALSLKELSAQLKGAFMALLEGHDRLANYFEDLKLLTEKGVLIFAGRYKCFWDLWTESIDDEDKEYEEGSFLYRCRLSCKNFINEDTPVKRIFVNKYIRLFVSKKEDEPDRIGKECRIVVYPVYNTLKDKDL